MMYTKEMQTRHSKVKKPKKINHKRGGTSQKRRGAIRPSVRAEVKERSKGLCEVRKRCNGAVAVHMAHIQSRNTIDETNSNTLLHACLACHQWMDFDAEGIKYKRSLREKDAG